MMTKASEIIEGKNSNAVISDISQDEVIVIDNEDYQYDLVRVY